MRPMSNRLICWLKKLPVWLPIITTTKSSPAGFQKVNTTGLYQCSINTCLLIEKKGSFLVIKYVFLEAIEYATFVGRTTRNVCASEMAKRQHQFSQTQLSKQLQTVFTSDCKFKSLFSRVNGASEMAKRQHQFSQTQLSKQLQTVFTSDCKFKSLFSRVNRCVKDYWLEVNSLFHSIDGVKVNQSPTLRLEVSSGALSFGSDFKNSWGGQSGTNYVHADLFLAFRDSVKDRFSTGVPTAFDPKDDNLRLPIGGEFSYSFIAPTFKRPRQPSLTRGTPEGKCKLLKLCHFNVTRYGHFPIWFWQFYSGIVFKNYFQLNVSAE